MTYGVGIHDIDIDVYHSQKVCDGVSVSSSGLRTIKNECPARFYAYSDLNKEPAEQKFKAAFGFGRAAHALMLGEPEFNAKFIVSPYETYQTNNARAWRDAQTKQIVKVADMVIIQEMCQALKKSTQASRAFKVGQPEKSIIWQHKETGIWLKARPDWMPDDLSKEFIIEYKTAATLKPRVLSADVFKYGYHMQAAMFLDGLAAVGRDKVLGVAHVVQEKEPPYLADLRMFSPEQIELGRREYLHALFVFANCLKTGKWPGWTSEPQFFDTPLYIQKQMEDHIDDNDGYDDDATGN